MVFGDVTVLAREPIVFAGNANGLEHFFQLEHWRVKIGDREDDRIVWVRGDFVLVVAITPEKKVVFIHEYKQAVEGVFLCLPAGAKREDETPQAAGLRELREEAGYMGTEEDCHVFDPLYNSPDKSTEQHYVVVFRNAIKHGPPTPEVSETILGVELLGLEEAKKKVQIGMHRVAIEMASDLLAALDQERCI